MTNNTYGTFKYGASKYGRSTDAISLWGVQIDWAGAGEFGSDNQAENVSNVRTRRGRDFFLRLDGQNRATGFQPVRPGVCTITIDDPDEIYEPNNTASPLYPNVEPGAAIRIIARQSPDGDKRYLFTGEVVDIQSYYESGAHKVRISALDNLQKLSDEDVRSTIQEDLTLSGAARRVLDLAEWPGAKRNIVESEEVMPYWWEDRRAFTGLDDLTETEGGYFFIDGSGNATYYPQFHQPTIAVDLDESELLKDVRLSRPWESVRNRIRAVANPISLEDEQEIWRLLDVPLLVAGETREIWASYSVDGAPVSAVDVVTPVATTDYTANAQADGGGANLTGDLTVSFAAFGQSAKITITNGATVPAFITLLKISGKPLIQSVPVFSELVIPPGRRLFVSDTRWRQSSTRAQYFAEWLGLFLPIRQPYPEIKIESRPDKQFEFDLFDRIALNIARKDIDRNFVVGAIEHEWLRETGQAVRTTVQLEPSRVPTDNVERVALEFQNESNSVLFNDMPQISGLPEMSLAFWICLTENVGREKLIPAISWVDAFDVGTRLSNKLVFRRSRETGILSRITTTNLIVDDWYHIVIAGEDTTAQGYQGVCYINGASETLIDQSTGSGDLIPMQTKMFEFGAFFSPARESFRGLLRDVRVYDRIITAAEAADLAADVDVRVGLLFHSNFIPASTQELYIDQPLAPKPIYETHRARAGFATGPNPVIVRDYDYEP